MNDFLPPASWIFLLRAAAFLWSARVDISCMAFWWSTFKEAVKALYHAGDSVSILCKR